MNGSILPCESTIAVVPSRLSLVYAEGIYSQTYGFLWFNGPLAYRDDTRADGRLHNLAYSQFFRPAGRREGCLFHPTFGKVLSNGLSQRKLLGLGMLKIYFYQDHNDVKTSVMRCSARLYGEGGNVCEICNSPCTSNIFPLLINIDFNL